MYVSRSLEYSAAVPAAETRCGEGRAANMPEWHMIVTFVTSVLRLDTQGLAQRRQRVRMTGVLCSL